MKMGCSIQLDVYYCLLFWTVGLPPSESAPAERAQWVNHGNGIRNWRNQLREQKIHPSTAPRLELKWVFSTFGDVSVTPSVADGVVYFPSWDGNLYAVAADSGSLVWSVNLTTALGIPGAISRSTPVICGKYLIVGIFGPAMIVAFKKSSAQVVWQKVVETAPLSKITMSGVCYGKYYYVGTSSLQESASVPPNCCNFIGSLVKLRITRGEVIWQTLMLPNNNGSFGLYSGAALWGSSPAIDEARRYVYVATGNLYSAPPEVEACEQAQQQLPKPEVPDPCVTPENRANAMVALNIDSGAIVCGAIVWSTVLGGYSAWTFACLVPDNPNCPVGPGTDYDFGEAPMLLSINGGKRDIAVAGQKSGTVWALDRDDGSLVWATVVGPGGPAGGAIWGSATDGARVFTNVANYLHLPWTLLPSTSVVTSGGWVALEAETGAILWSVADPAGSFAYGPVSYANHVLFTTSAVLNGSVYALDASSGQLLWRSDKPASSVYGGWSISNGCGFVGEGYASFPILGLSGGNKLFCYCVEHSK